MELRNETRLHAYPAVLIGVGTATVVVNGWWTSGIWSVGITNAVGFLLIASFLWFVLAAVSGSRFNYRLAETSPSLSPAGIVAMLLATLCATPAMSIYYEPKCPSQTYHFVNDPSNQWVQIQTPCSRAILDGNPWPRRIAEAAIVGFVIGGFLMVFEFERSPPPRRRRNRSDDDASFPS